MVSKLSIPHPQPTKNKTKQAIAEQKRARLAKALRENLLKRKAQSRERVAPMTPEDVVVSE